jgi:peptidoglycan/LPS O-acetylase OafA/YrhL
MKASGNRYASLDGFRAVSIFLVILSHITSPAIWSITKHLWRLQLGNLGVRIFFVISGFLITSILLAEKEASGRISLRNFYIRRIFRIAPAYYAMLFAVALLIPLGLVTVGYRDLPPVFLYISNYSHTSFSLGHTWSLAVEEQFYILWPCALVYLGAKRGAACAAVFLLIAPLLRVADQFIAWDNARFAFETVGDALATGCLLALFRRRLWSSERYRVLLSSNWFPLFPLAIVIALAAERHELIRNIIGLSVLNVTIAISLDRYMRFPEDAFGRFLNRAPVAWIGTLSYSIYLWQQLFLREDHQFAFPLNIAGAFAAALASYYLIEQPFLRMRTGFLNPENLAIGLPDRCAPITGGGA